MAQKESSRGDIRPKDKVRISIGPFAGERAVVEKVKAASLDLRLRDSSQLVTVEKDGINNFSAAARKAWKTMPERSVGRPRGRTTNRRSVTLRLDESIWARFTVLEDQGEIPDRSSFIEQVLEERLNKLEKSPRDKKAHV
jgi:uncharacterized protein (DUF4415 family)